MRETRGQRPRSESPMPTRQARRARALGLDPGIHGFRTGAINVLQRFGGALNLNLHFHALVLDGVYTRKSLLGAEDGLKPVPPQYSSGRSRGETVAPGGAPHGTSARQSLCMLLLDFFATDPTWFKIWRIGVEERRQMLRRRHRGIGVTEPGSSPHTP